jgi:peptide/nickel transport system substrate-binding protein
MAGSIRRRTALKLGAAAAVAGGLARPAIAQSSNQTLRFVPQADLSTGDALWSSAQIAFNASYMYADQLFGLNSKLLPQPQMVEGYELSDDRLNYRFKLREGLFFHDGEPVRAQDAMASINRWSQRDLFGKRLASLLNEMTAVDDRTFDIKLKKPFAQLIYGLGATSCFILPERIANSANAFTQIKEYVGSGPYRFLKDEWVIGSRAAFARFDKYVPRQEPPDFWSGGKVVHLDRVEWLTRPDPSTAAAALQTKEVDWVERPLFDLLPTLRGTNGLKVEVIDPLGTWTELHFNNAIPPFDDPKLRRAFFPAVNQADFMEALVGDQANLMRTGVGPFLPGSPYASNVGMEAITGPRDLALAKKLVAESGYKGQMVVQMAASDLPTMVAYGAVGQQMLQQCGINVDYQSMDWGTLLSRWNSPDPTAQAKWNCFVVGWSGLWITNPGTNIPLHGQKKNPKMEALTEDWYSAPDMPSQQKITAEMQRLYFEDPPFIPVGQYFVPQAHRDIVTDIMHSSLTVFWNVKKAT